MTENKLSQILIVEDDPDALNLFSMYLRRANYIVIEADAGERCLTLLSQLEPDLILLDIKMPGIDGFETCRRIKAIPRSAEIPIIFLTALEQTENKIEGFQAGGVDYIVKPPQPEELFARIENQLELKRDKKERIELNKQLEESIQKHLVELHNESLWRHQYEQEVAKLLEMVRHQEERLATLMQYSMVSNGSEQVELRNMLLDLPQAYLNLLSDHLLLAYNHARAAENKTAGILLTEHLVAAMKILSTLKEQLLQASIEDPHVTDNCPLPTPFLSKLSMREQEILRMIADGQSNADIAQILSLADPTVRVHRSRIMGKLHLNNVAALVKFALKHNLTSVT